MSYIINKYNGTQVAVVTNGTTNSALDLTLIGKNYAGYGEVQNENFVFLLENFAGTAQPAKPITGQLWFDAGTNKLKFYDVNGRFRVAGSAEASATAPVGASIGDLWLYTTTNQLKVWTGAIWDLVGPQRSSSSSITEMVTTSVQDDSSISHDIIQAVNNGVVVFTVSADPTFTLNSATPITGFDVIHQGVTLVYTTDSSNGQTSSEHRLWGTASNADRLGGLPASSFVQTGDAAFSTLVNFADVGYTVGYPVSKLKVFNDSATTPTFYNQVLSGSTVFKTTLSTGAAVTPMVLTGRDVLPGTTTVSNLGSVDYKWSTVYANTFNGTATQSDKLKIGASSYISADSSATANTIVARTSTAQTINGTNVTAGAIQATYFVGIATTANYADLAEKYLADADYEIGTVMSIGGTAEVTAAQHGDRALGAISSNPAYLMNDSLEGGTIIALKGRIPVKVFGPVKKGDRLVAGGAPGCAVAVEPTSPSVVNTFAQALETSSELGINLVECVIL